MQEHIHVNKEQICSVDNCVGPAYARGMCSRHYRSWHRYGDPIEIENRCIKRGKQPLDMSVLGAPINSEDTRTLVLAMIVNAMESLTPQGVLTVIHQHLQKDPRYIRRARNEAIDFLFSNHCYLEAFNMTSRELIESVGIDIDGIRLQCREHWLQDEEFLEEQLTRCNEEQQ